MSIEIYKAALSDDWNSADQIFKVHPEFATEPINDRGETPLMIAVGTNCSHDFVQKLCARFRSESNVKAVTAKNCEENNALHFAAKVGNMTAAKILVEQIPSMTSSCNKQGKTPLILAASLGRKELLRYFIIHTPKENNSSFDDGYLLNLTIQAGFLDVALELFNMHPYRVQEDNRQIQSIGVAMKILATKPELFPSRSRLGFWDRLLYSFIPINESQKAHGEEMQEIPINESQKAHGEEMQVIPINESQKAHGEEMQEIPISKSQVTLGEENQVNRSSNIFNKIATRFWRLLPHLAQAIDNIQNIKLQRSMSIQLVQRICKIIIEKDNHPLTSEMLGSTIATAVRYGAYEIIEECILAYPNIIWYTNSEGYDLFHLAIMERQEQVYNLIYQMTSHKVFVASKVDDKRKENMLHIAAKLAPRHRLNIITGAALQMQRELQWFKEVETLVEPSYKEALNKKGKTPRMVFTDQHKGLLREGQQWMKDTSSSCTVVAALIVTIAFAAAFTVPGGNKDDGKPMFLNNGVFMLFIISDAIALFASSTSLLMFLGILTSRYAEDDFLYPLPKRMTIGLVSLFLSLAYILIAFSATLALVLQDKVTWIAAPLVIMTSIPVCLFALLQFPLLKELVLSTYGPSIFRKQNYRMIY